MCMPSDFASCRRTAGLHSTVQVRDQRMPTPHAGEAAVRIHHGSSHALFELIN